MQLSSQVLLVAGYRRWALYDLDRGLLQRIPMEIGLQLSSDKAELRSCDRVWAEYLKDNGFISSYSPKIMSPKFTLDWRFAKYPLVHTIEFESYHIFVETQSWLLKRSRLRGGPRHLVINGLSKHSERHLKLIMSAVRAIGCTSFELRKNRNAVSRIYDETGVLRYFRKKRVVRKISDKLAINQNSYIKLKHQSELAGYLYINKEGIISPHYNERTIFFGNIAELSYDALIESVDYRSVAHNSKDSRDVCKHCELRYACLHPFTDRVSDLMTSMPKHCLYDPLDPKSQNDLFA